MLIEHHSPMIAICKSLFEDQEKKMMYDLWWDQNSYNQ